LGLIRQEARSQFTQWQHLLLLLLLLLLLRRSAAACQRTRLTVVRLPFAALLPLIMPLLLVVLLRRWCP
jgi:hypothetical protein